jgi:site-specific DNA-cytosine methylase
VISLVWTGDFPYPTIQEYLLPRHCTPVDVVSGVHFQVSVHNTRSECDMLKNAPVGADIILFGIHCSYMGLFLQGSVANSWPNMKHKRSLIQRLDLRSREAAWLEFCAGIGGFSFALKEIGETVVQALELEPHIVEMYRMLHRNEAYIADITDLDNAGAFLAAECWAGGAPCQAFSQAGSMAGWRDRRAEPLLCIMLFAALFRPRWILIENVPKLVEHKPFADTLYKILAEIGYSPDVSIIQAAEFLPQSRQRAIISLTRTEDKEARTTLVRRQRELDADTGPTLGSLGVPADIHSPGPLLLDEATQAVYFSKGSMPGPGYPRVARADMQLRTVMHSYGMDNRHERKFGQLVHHRNGRFRFLHPVEILATLGFPPDALHVIAMLLRDADAATLLKWMHACGNSLPVWTIIYALSTIIPRDRFILNEAFVQNYVRSLKIGVWPVLSMAPNIHTA